MMTSVGPAQIIPRLRKLRAKWPDAGVIGFHSKQPWAGGPTLRVDDEELQVASCRSELEIREKLCGRANGDDALVLLTQLEANSLATDVLARLCGRRLYKLDSWAVVRELFSAAEIDARLATTPWLVDALLEHAGTTTYLPAPGGFLSMDHAWSAFLSRALGMSPGQPDLEALIEWTRTSDLERYRTLRQDVAGALADRMASSAGEAGRYVLAAVAGGYGRDALALGLVFDVVFRQGNQAVSALAQAQARLERFVGATPIPADVAARWAAAAKNIVHRTLEEASWSRVADDVARAEALLVEAQASEYLAFSDILPAGLDARLRQFAEAIGATLDGGGSIAMIEEHASSARGHLRVKQDDERARDVTRKVMMAERLCRWLSAPTTAPTSFAKAALTYTRDGALADRANDALRGGDAEQTFSQACDRLRSTVTERLERDAREFAGLLREWMGTGSTDDSVLPIEDVLDRLLAPLAKSGPLLLLVLDGMSSAVFEEIASDLTSPRNGWLPLAPVDDRTDGSIALSAPPVIGALPTITNYCRTSLLAGKLVSGGQDVERREFAEHTALREVSTVKYPPKLFHKGELVDTDETQLSEKVRGAVASSDRKIVAVVLNAVDDVLSGSDQMPHTWNVDSILFLRALIDTARAAGRAVVLTSDHGHVLDTGTEARAGGDSDRWRPDDGSPADDEVVVSGPRVAEVMGGAVIAPWSRRVRYSTKKKYGYHGGASPQEVVVPLGVFVPPGVAREGWKPTALSRPDWWIGTSALPRPVQEPKAVPAVASRRPTAPRSTAQQPGLFEDWPEPAPAAPAARTWVDDLLQSEIYQAQRAQCARTAPPDERVRAVLDALNERGGKLTRAALAQRLDLPPLRLQGVINGVRQILNVEGYNVVSIDDGSDTVELNLSLLQNQFVLTAEEGPSE